MKKILLFAIASICLHFFIVSSFYLSSAIFSSVQEVPHEAFVVEFLSEDDFQPVPDRKTNEFLKKKKIENQNSRVEKLFVQNSLRTGIQQNSLKNMEDLIRQESERAKEGFHGQAGLGSGLFVEGVRLEEGITGTTFWRSFAKKLNESLIYPEDLLKMRRDGRYQIDFFVNRKGQLIDNFVRVSGKDPYLSLYVQALLIQTLKDPIHERDWYQVDRKIPVTVQINFEINTATYPAVPSEVNFENNFFTLTRRAFLDPLWVEKMDRIMTRYVPPIIPVPGGVYVDIIRLVEYLKNLDPNAIDPDERLLQRVQLNREQLEKFIRDYQNNKTELDSRPEGSQISREPMKTQVT